MKVHESLLQNFQCKISILQLGMSGWFGKYSFRCEPVDYSMNPLAVRVSILYKRWYHGPSRCAHLLITYYLISYTTELLLRTTNHFCSILQCLKLDKHSCGAYCAGISEIAKFWGSSARFLYKFTAWAAMTIRRVNESHRLGISLIDTLIEWLKSSKIYQFHAARIQSHQAGWGIFQVLKCAR